MKISIAMATYNGAAYLQEQLYSIASQSRCPDEIVICDDGSLDNTLCIIDEFKKKVKYPVYLYCNNENLGFAANFEKAINLCKYDIIVLSDQDDIWYSDKLKTLELAFGQSDNAKFFISNADILNEKGKKIGDTLWRRRSFTFEKNRNLCGGDQFAMLLRFAISTGMVSAFTKQVREIAGPLPEGISHDRWYILVAAGIKMDGVILSRSLAGYRQHERQLVGTLKPGLFHRITKRDCKKKYNFDKQLHHLSTLLNRLIYIKPDDESAQVVYLKENIEHLKTRNEILQTVLWKRPLIVMAELANGRYRKYSGGIYSAFLDLVSEKCF